MKLRVWVLIVAHQGLIGCAEPASAGAPADANPLQVSRGELARRSILTGELDAVHAETLTVPRNPQWNVTLRWLERDGAQVRAGQTVAELDNTSFTAHLAEKKTEAAKAETALAHQRAHDAIVTAEKTFAVETARVLLAKARLEANIDPDTITARAAREKQLALERAESALAEANDNLATHVASAALELEIREIDRAKAEREIKAAEQGIEDMVLRAPRDGLVILARHQWWGRKVEIGDSLFVGLPVARLPDLSVMKVNALCSDVDDGQLRVGLRTTAFLDAYPDEPFAGTISEVSPVARAPAQGSQRRFFLVTVTLDRTDRERMRPGMSVRLETEVERSSEQWLVPRASLDMASDPAVLYVADGTTAAVKTLMCNLHSCAVEPEAGGAALRAGLLLRTAPVEGS